MMHENIKAQIQDPKRHNDNHIRLSLIWQTTQNIKRIQSELVLGYSFDKDKLTEMVNAMFSFINGAVSPDADIKSSEVVTDEISN